MASFKGRFILTIPTYRTSKNISQFQVPLSKPPLRKTSAINKHHQSTSQLSHIRHNQRQRAVMMIQQKPIDYTNRGKGWLAQHGFTWVLELTFHFKHLQSTSVLGLTRSPKTRVGPLPLPPESPLSPALWPPSANIETSRDGVCRDGGDQPLGSLSAGFADL